MTVTESARAVAEPAPSADELVARAAAMVPWLRKQADAVEQARTVPEETIDRFRDAGFFRVLQPARWGGWEMDPVVFWRILAELGRGCGSSAWNMMILGVHQWEFGLMDPRVGDDVWGEDNTVLVASSYAPFGTVREVDGGYVLDGRWLTSSGCDHGEWAFIGGFLKRDDGLPVDRCAFLVPRHDYEIIDDWFTFGLAGTGSKSLVLRDVFVPSYRMHSIVNYAPSPEASPIYRIPFHVAFFASVSAVITGFAQGAIDVYVEQMRTRENVNGIGLTQLSPYAKDRLGNAVARVRSCRMRLEQIAREVGDTVTRGDLVSIDDRIRYTLDTARVGRECEEAVMLLFKATSARGVFLSNPIQRILRDTLVAANHITQNADDNAGALGGYLLGQGLPPLLYETLG